MKKTIQSLLILCALMISSVSIAQIEEGIITYKKTFDSDDPDVKSQLAMVGEMSETVYFKDDKRRTEQSGAMTGSTITIIGDDGMLILMDNMMGKKYVKMTEDEMEETSEDKDEPEVEVEETDDTKDILGYACKKYIVTVDDNEMVLYVTDEIENKEAEDKFDGKIKGMPLYMEIEMSQMGMTFTIVSEATKVEKKKLDKDLFDINDIPEGYEETSTEALKSMGGM